MSSMTTRKACLCFALAGVVLFAIGSTAQADFQSFDDPNSAAAAGWSATSSSPAWSNSNNAQGASGAGEAGGTISRTSTYLDQTYADFTGIALNPQTDTMAASGRIILQDSDPNNIDPNLGVNHEPYLCWFRDPPDFGGASIEAVGASFKPPGSGDSAPGFWLARASAWRYWSGPGVFLTDNTAYDFELNYDPLANGGDGTITASFTPVGGGATLTDTLNIPDTFQALTGILNGFGMSQNQEGDDDPAAQGAWFIDDVSYSVPEPSAVLLLLIGLVGLVGYGWRQR